MTNSKKDVNPPPMQGKIAHMSLGKVPRETSERIPDGEPIKDRRFIELFDRMNQLLKEIVQMRVQMTVMASHIGELTQSVHEIKEKM